MAAKRKRTATGKTHTEAVTQGLQIGDPRSPNQGKRPERVPMGVGMNLAVYESGLDTEHFYYHWMAEQPSRGGRLQQAIQAGYEHETDAQGEKITRRTGAGIQYLMKLPMEYREEDLKRKRDIAQANMDKQTRLNKHEYAPDSKGRAEGGTSSIVSRHETDNPFAG